MATVVLKKGRPSSATIQEFKAELEKGVSTNDLSQKTGWSVAVIESARAGKYDNQTRASRSSPSAKPANTEIQLLNLDLLRAFIRTEVLGALKGLR